MWFFSLVLLCQICRVFSSNCDPFMNAVNANPNSTAALFANGTCLCDVKPCFMKCCPPGQASPTRGSRNCTSRHDFALGTVVGDLPTDYLVITGFPACSFYMPDEDESWKVLRDGTFTSSMADVDEIHHPGFFCIEYFDFKSDYWPLVCIDERIEAERNEPGPATHFLIYPIGMMASMPFLVATFLIYALFPQLQNLHGRCLVSHIAALIISYMSLTVVMLHYNTHVSDSFCTILGKHLFFPYIPIYYSIYSFYCYKN